MNSYWIWKYGDYELFHSNRVNCRREEYDAKYPPFWDLSDVDRSVRFYSDVNTERDGFITLYVNGLAYILIDGKRYPSDRKIDITAGHHSLQITLCNLTGLPAAFIESDVVASDDSWFSTNARGERTPCGFDKYYDSPDKNPEVFPFSYERRDYVSCEQVNGGILYDFGKEMYGHLYISGVSADEEIYVGYGESREESLDREWACVRETVTGSDSYKLVQRAFRYIWIYGTAKPTVYAELEYLPLAYRGRFECDIEAVNDIWDMCAYTLHLNAREVFTEAIKRDRWLWGGDAYQESKFNRYLFHDSYLDRRSIIGLRGKDPVTEHINTITDYTLLWFVSLEEYYMAYGDIDFIRFIYPRAVTLMDFCRTKEDENGFIVGRDNDWIFVDWANIDKSGVVCAEQVLYVKALRTMYTLSKVVGKENEEYKTQAEALLKKLNEYFWNEELGAYIDNFRAETPQVTRHANVFAVAYDVADEHKKAKIVENVLNNDSIAKITTPYFEGYELDAMGKVGNLKFIYDMIMSYWKGMMDLGATTVWEEYIPSLSGVEHYAMYGGKFQKSLCHGWGASPIYLLGKYFLGVSETSAGYETFTVKPALGEFGYIKGAVPVRDGEVEVYLDKKMLKVTSTVNGGTLVWKNKEYALVPGETITIENE